MKNSIKKIAIIPLLITSIISFGFASPQQSVAAGVEETNTVELNSMNHYSYELEQPFTASADTLQQSVAAGDEETNTVEFNSMNHYCYELEQPFTVSPDTFEAWIKLPKGSVGGTIMGNFTFPGTGYGGIVDWSIDGFGKVKIYWNDGRFKYTFNHTALDDNVWHHIAVVRDEDNRAFMLYIDGELADYVACVTTGAINANHAMAVGVGHENYGTPKNPFEGYIRQITVYNGAITAERVASDMQTAVITDDYNGKMIGNWYFGDVWTKRGIEETSGSSNHAILSTFEKYVGVAGEDFEYDYSIAILGDVQAIVGAKPELYYEMTQWIADNADNKKIEFAIQLGDLSDSGAIAVGSLSNQSINESQYRVAAQGLAALDNKVPYCFVPGNHDYDYVDSGNREQLLFNRYFPYEKHSALPGFAGAYREGDMANTYYTFNAGGIDYLVLNLEYEPRMPVMRWACRICEQHPRHRIIVNTHSYMTNYGSINERSNLNAKDGVSTSGTELFEGLIKRYENIFLVLCGHVCYDDVVIRHDTGIHGNTITSIMINPQGVTYGKGLGEDLVFIMNFNEKTEEINCYYYSPHYDAVWNLQNQFRLKYWF